MGYHSHKHSRSSPCLIASVFEGVLRHDVEMRSGHTPFQSFGSWPILSIAFAVLILCSNCIQKIKTSSGM